MPLAVISIWFPTISFSLSVYKWASSLFCIATDDNDCIVVEMFGFYSNKVLATCTQLHLIRHSSQDVLHGLHIDQQLWDLPNMELRKDAL